MRPGYTYVDRQDLDEIIDSHLVAGRIVERLKIDPRDSVAPERG